MIWHGLAAAVSLGAWLSWTVGVGPIVVVAGYAFVRRSVIALLVGAVLVGGWLSARSISQLEPPDGGPVKAWVTLTTDPRPSGPVGVRASARWGSHHISLSAHGPVAGRLDDLLAGEQVRIEGTFRPARPGDDWARWRHQVGTVTVTEVLDRAAGSPLTRFAYAIRLLLQEGSRSLERDDLAVFAGMVLGDDREQSAVVADDFRAAGLGHLLVVSGQNVAFVLALVEPLTRRTRPGARLGIVALTLLVFLTLTRFEASVLRASAMAGAGVGAAVLGGPIDGRRALSASIVLLVLIDPFLVRVLAFQLSVAATAGIVWFSVPLAQRMRGPAVFRVAVATTTAAQLAVAPLLLVTFGPLPLASLPANLIAGPVSGPIMVWGWTAGLLAGMVGGPIAELVHLPTALMVGWVRGAGVVAASGPYLSFGWVEWFATSAGLLALVAGPKPRLRQLGALLMATGVLLGVGNVAHVAPGWTETSAGASLHRGEVMVLVLDDPHGPERVLEQVRKAGVRQLALIVASDGDRADANVVIALQRRYGPVPVLAPQLHSVPTARSIHSGESVAVDGLVIVVQRRGAKSELAVVGPDVSPGSGG